MRHLQICSKLLLCLLTTCSAIAQVTTVQPLGYIPAAQAAQGLGFNIKGYPWEFPLMQQLGVKHVRFDCSWGATEVRRSDNSSGGYSLPTSCANVLRWSKEFGMTPQLNALYGPPFGKIASVNPASFTAVGAHTIELSAAARATMGQLAKACFDANSKPLCEVLKSPNTQITDRFDYSGSLIASINVSAGTFTLASATRVPLTTTDDLTVNQLMYAPITIPFYASTNMTDPSVMAYVNYARFLGQQEAASGLSCAEVGLWNEPQWTGALWIHGQAFWDIAADAPNGLNQDAVGSTIPIIVAAQPEIPGVKYVNNWTNKSATTMLSYALFNYTSIKQVQRNVAAEAIHPYGSFPEQAMWDPNCVRQQARLRDGKYDVCILAGSVHGQNLGYQTFAAATSMMAGGVPVEITETGMNTKDWTINERFETRQFLGYEALGVSPIMFFSFVDSPASYYAWVDSNTHMPNPIYEQFLPLMKDIISISGPPADPVAACSSPIVSHYNGSYILNTVTMQGTRANSDRSDSILFFTWQKSNGNGTGNSHWTTTASPIAAPISVLIPKGHRVVKVVDSITTRDVKFSVDGLNLTYAVADNPIEVLVEPIDANSVASSCERNEQ